MPSVGSVDEFAEFLRSSFDVAASTEQYRTVFGRLRRGRLQELHLEVRLLVNNAFQVSGLSRQKFMREMHS